MNFKFTKDDVVILDFDNTIWIWRRDYISDPNREDLTLKRLRGESTYTNESGFIPDFMKDLLLHLKDNDVVTYVLSACDTSVEFLEKSSLLQRRFNLPATKVLGVSTADYKVVVIESLKRLNPGKNFILIDDRLDTLKECKSRLGITVMQPLELLDK